MLRPIPAVAWIPLAILLWPTEESSIVFITFLGALFPIVLNTATGAENTPELLLRAARSLGAPPAQIFRHVVIPAALPSIGACAAEKANASIVQGCYFPRGQLAWPARGPTGPQPAIRSSQQRLSFSW